MLRELNSQGERAYVWVGGGRGLSDGFGIHTLLSAFGLPLKVVFIVTLDSSTVGTCFGI